MKKLQLNSKRKKNNIEEGNESISCRDCGQQFTRRDNYNRHMATVHERKKQDKKSGNHLCQICEKCFSRSDNLKSHVSQVHGGKPLHEGKKPHECHICGKKWARKWNLAQHIATVHKYQNG